MTVNERIKEIRKSKELTMDKFGECIGVTKAAISKIEKGERGVTEQMVKSICREFGYNEKWLRDGIEPKKPVIDEDMEYGQICAELGINDNRAKQIILNYGRFSPDDKKLFWEYIDRLIDTTGQSR
ncbi:MAG: helix-turn-helix transcriptional regulator [Lachnospiraceae bacterium]|nr:helix-turn-helix transcriptional regulator [Lachnospiraceae bacterium]